MAITPRLEKVSFQKCSEVTNKNKIECKLGVCEEDLQVLCSNACASLSNAEIIDGEIRFNGKAIFSAVCSNGKDLQKYESGVEFSYKFNSGVSGFCKFLNFAKVDVLDVEVVKQNGVLLATATILFTGEVCKEEDIEQISFTNADFLIKKHSLNKSEVIATVKKSFKLQEEFEVAGNVKDVIRHYEKAYLTSSQCGIGCVINDGEVELNMALKTNSESGSIIFERRKIPFRLESEAVEVMPNNVALSNLEICGSNVRVYVDESKGKSLVNFEVELYISSVIYENIAYNYCEDAYSTTCNLKLEKSKKSIETITEVESVEKKIVGELAYFDENAGLICVLNDKIEEISSVFNGSEIIVKGVASISMLLNDNGEVKCQTSLVPFEANFLARCSSVKNINCAIVGVNVEKLDGKFTFSFILKVGYACVSKQEVNVLLKVEEGEKKPLNDSAISVYIASKGEDLWDVCKALNASEEVILNSNGELVFPLEKEERILIYRELNKGEA